MWLAALLATLLLVVSCRGPATKTPVSAHPPSGDWNGRDGGDAALQFFRTQPRDPSIRHVHAMHVDGLHAELFHQMLEVGMLPHFELLLARGKVSFTAATVDKSETFKVIQAYLTSRLDTEITAWWFFDRHTLRFHNYWLDPVDVVSYALGLEFPLTPTIFDVVVGHGDAVAAGFNLHRRSVPFTNYARAYTEGARAAFRHTYYAQAHATMSGMLAIYERIARDNAEPMPAFVLSLLAPADEYGHLQGMIAPRGDGGELAAPIACFERAAAKQRGDDPYEAIFQILDDDRRAGGWYTDVDSANPNAGMAALVTHRHFTAVDVAGDEVRRICIRVPELTVAVEPSDTPTARTRERANPNVVLAMLEVDMELGRLIETLRSIRPDPHGGWSFVAPPPGGIMAYLRDGHSEGSLFENTLFVFTGDHGMVTTPAMMVHPDPEQPQPARHPSSLRESFLEYLDRRTGLVMPARRQPAPSDGDLGIDDKQLPLELAFPHAVPDWQSPAIREQVAAAQRWTDEFLAEVRTIVSGELYQQYWWLLFLRRVLIDAQLDEALAPYRDTARAIITQLYLRGDPSYMAAQDRFVRDFYDRRVRLVYGGGALNNAEIFLPSPCGSAWCWNRRPSFAELMRGVHADVVRALADNPGVGLLFVREQNGEIAPGRPLPREMTIRVSDRAGRVGTIHVRRDPATRTLVFAYDVAPGARGDPLEYGDLADGTWRTYNQWNDLSVERQHAYHNAVAGMGAYLYSTNTSIGDITAMHAQGWNFGDNAGGHGGMDRDEKLTAMLVSGPGIRRGELMGEVTSAGGGASTGTTQPTVLDIAPTVLSWLGYGDQALVDFARNGFAAQLDEWVAAQRAEIVANLDNIGELNAELHALGFDDVRLSDFRARLDRLLAFLPSSAPTIPRDIDPHTDGNLLDLQ